MQDNLRTVNVGLIGLGTVGGGVARTILSHHDRYLDAYNIDLKITRACGLVWEQAEAAGITPEQFTSDWHDVVSDESIDIVVELIGGEHPATEIYEAAFAAGKHVVTANKALLGRHVESFARAAREHGVQLKCEASCGGGIPIVSTLERDLVGNEILTAWRPRAPITPMSSPTRRPKATPRPTPPPMSTASTPLARRPSSPPLALAPA